MKFETLDCLKDCSGACCKILLIPIRGDLPEDYLDARGLSIYQFEDKRYLVVPSVCKYLTEEGKCSIQDTKPSLCRSQEPGCAECRACREILKAER